MINFAFTRASTIVAFNIDFSIFFYEREQLFNQFCVHMTNFSINFAFTQASITVAFNKIVFTISFYGTRGTFRSILRSHEQV